MHVLRRFRAALVPDGIVLDLQVIRPNPRAEVDGRVLCEIDGSPLFAGADAARAAVDLLVAERLLVEEAVDDHDVLKHYRDDAELRAFAEPCVTRERCRLRRLRRAG